MMSEETMNVTIGQDNIFEDLGFTPQEALNLQIRADLMLDLRDYIQRQGWSPQDAASFLGETKAMMNDLVDGEIDQFTVDQLIYLLGKVGMKVEVRVVTNVA